MEKSTARLSGLLLAALLCWAIPLHAQNSNASIAGSGTDQSGPLLPNPTLTLTLTPSGTARNATTGLDGNFSFPNIPIGTYELECTAHGFKSFRQSGITLHLNDVVNIPVQLELGAASQTIEVSANASPLNFQTPVVQQGIRSEEHTSEL